jgi:carboxyl-terminal processing protease
LVQQTKDLAYGTRLKVTVSKYYTPSGRCIQRYDYGAGGAVIADSLTKTFTTQNGRMVRDGVGIEPDVEVPVEYMSYVHEGMLEAGVIFDFGTRWAAEHDTLVLDGWSLSEEDWEAFVAFAAEQPVPYAARSMEWFERLEQEAREEQFFEVDSAAFLALEGVLKADVRRDLARFREEIQASIEHELVMRMHPLDAYIAWTQSTDEELLKAVELLQNQSYRALLAGPQD